MPVPLEEHRARKGWVVSSRKPSTAPLIRYARTLRDVLPCRWFVIGAAALLSAGALWAATRLPSTFFPEIDESMERVYVRFAPGISLDESSRRIDEMAKMLVAELPKGEVELVLTNIGSPNNARSAMTSPNNGPHMGFIRVALVDPGKRKHSQRALADQMRALLTQHYPGVEFLQWPGGLVASVFANGYIAPMVVEVRNENLELLEKQSHAVQEVARDVAGIRDMQVSLQTDYPELHVDTVREQAGLVGVTPRTAAQATLEATLGNINKPGVWIDPANGQSYYVVTYYDEKAVADPTALALLPVKVAASGKVVPIGAYAQLRRAVGPAAIERDHMTRVANVMMQTEGRDIGSAADELEQRLRTDARTRGVQFGWVGQVDLMRSTFSGLGTAIGIAVMVVFMLLTIQFKSLKLPLVMFLTIPATSIGIVFALMIAGQGFSITALMGVLMVIGIAVSNGILLVDEAARGFNAGADAVEAVVHAARIRFVPIAMTSLATIIGLLPTAMALEAGTEANQPLGLAVVGGLTSSTLLSLFLVPCFFVLLAKRAPAPDAAPQQQPVPDPAHT